MHGNKCFPAPTVTAGINEVGKAEPGSWCIVGAQDMVVCNAAGCMLVLRGLEMLILFLFLPKVKTWDETRFTFLCPQQFWV